MTENNESITENFNFDLPKNRSNVIKVIGIGGGGGNAINYMFQQGIVGVDFVICNTDAQALEKSSVPIKIQLGASLTEGLGAGANPNVGRQAAQESIEDLTQLLSTQTKMVFLTAGMGGGTGTGAAPIIARMAKEMDILTVGIVTMPFQFEGKIRLEQAQKGLEELKSNVDSLIVINNNKLREVYGNLGFKAGFAKADEVLATAARGIAEVITHHYTQNIDLKDAKTVLSNSGSAIMGSATAQGANRAQESIVKALDSPLLNDNKITGCKNVLLLIVSGEEEITIDEIGEINDFIQNEAGNNTNIIMGVGEDMALGDQIAVTIIATGFNSEQQHEIVNTEAKKVIHTLEEEQPLVHDLTDEVEEESVFETPIVKNEEVDAPIIKHVLTEDDQKESSIKQSHEEHAQEEHELEAFVAPAEATVALSEIEEKIVEAPVVEVPIAEENDLIPTTLAISSLPVDAEQVVSEKEVFEDEITPIDFSENVVEEDGFVFNDINAMEVVDAEEVAIDNEQQIQFDFELPLTASPLDETKIPEETTEESVVFQLDETMNFMDVEPSTEKEETPLEEELSISLKTVEAQEEEKVEQEIPASSPLNEELKSPFEQSIQSSINQQNQKRKEQLKQFNHTFKNNLSRIEEMERQPAYKRLGFDLSESEEQDPPSSLSLDNDSNDDIQLRSNNSFLHDNVD